jgi:hypothetical protein
MYSKKLLREAHMQLWPLECYYAGTTANTWRYYTVIYEGGHNNSSANRQNHNSGILEQGGDAVTVKVLKMSVGNMDNTHRMQQLLTMIAQLGQ